jgi:hypothetical protein
MFLRYFEALWTPFKYVRNQIMKVRNVHGRIRVDVNRVKSYKQLAKYRAKEAKQMAANAKKKAANVRGRLSGGAPGQPAPGAMPAPAMAGGPMGGPHPMGGAMAGGPMGPPRPMAGGPMAGGPMGGAPMAYQPPGGGAGGPPMGPGPAPAYPRPGGGPGGPGGPPAGWPPGAAPGPGGFPPGGSGPMNGLGGGIVVTGALWWKKHLCAQCGQQLDKTWDRCPYCSQGAPVAASSKTQAIQIDVAGVGNGLQLCGWLVPLKGAQRGELYTLDPISAIGTDPGCTVVLTDSYMSGRHCEIRAEGGTWILRDLKSTNGTYVNDKRVEKHELVDSDFVRLGNSVLKFKSL